ncbi:MAG: ABC transporter permease [Oscillospiraceae bacterium]
MTGIMYITRRNVKMFFKDKGMFFSSLITPIILLVLYVTFLYNVYRDSFTSALPDGFSLSDGIIDGFVGSLLFSSLLAVCTVTVSFCANLFMVADKVTGARNDLTIAPIKPSVLALGYYFATVISSLIVCFAATGISFIYLAKMGWYLSASDVFFVFVDIILLVMFGTALSSIVCFPLTTQGQMSAVGTIVSAGYGFLCGAYMPISQFSNTMQKVLSFLPGTYGTSLIRNHAMNGVYNEMLTQNMPKQFVDGIRDSFDCNLYFFGDKVETSVMYAILAGSVALLILVYVIMNVLKKEK